MFLQGQNCGTKFFHSHPKKSLRSPECEGSTLCSLKTRVWDPLDSFKMTTSHSKDQTWLNNCDSQLNPQPSGRRKDLKVELITNGQGCNQTCLHSTASIKTQRDGIRMCLPVGGWTHWDTCRVRCSLRTWTAHSSHTFSPVFLVCLDVHLHPFKYSLL